MSDRAARNQVFNNEQPEVSENYRDVSKQDFNWEVPVESAPLPSEGKIYSQNSPIYGKSTLDWVVLTTAGIVNVRNEWPLSSKELYDFTVEKYGIKEINNVRHYETKEIKNSRGVVILPSGNIVDSGFSVTWDNFT